MFDTAPKTHGKARFASNRQLRKGGWLSSSGVHLGYTMKGNQALRHDGEEHILTVAQPGAGKTVGLVIPTLLTYRGSVVITDPKAALVAQTAKAREKLGSKVVILNPWADEIAAATGEHFTDTGFNPLRILRAGDPAVIDNAEMLAKMLCPEPAKGDKTWAQRGASILTGCLLYLSHAEGEECTLPRLYSLVRDTEEGWKDLAAKMMQIETINLDDYAAVILSPLKAEKQWAGIEQELHNATEIYNPQKALGQHVSRDEFDPAALKGENLTVYLVIPSNKREANKDWLALVMALCAEAVGRPGPAKRVLLLAEEFANLGYMPTIKRAMAEYREAGLRCWLIIQNLPQLESIYGRDGMNEIINLCAIRQYFAVDDVDLASRLERTIGQHTITETSISQQRTGILVDGMKGSDTTRETGVPYMRMQDILNLPKSHQIITTSGEVPPILAQVKPFFETALNAKAGQNPYRKSASFSGFSGFHAPALLEYRIVRACLWGLGIFLWLIFVVAEPDAPIRTEGGVGNMFLMMTPSLLLFGLILDLIVPRILRLFSPIGRFLLK